MDPPALLGPYLPNTNSTGKTPADCRATSEAAGMDLQTLDDHTALGASELEELVMPCSELSEAETVPLFAPEDLTACGLRALTHSHPSLQDSSRQLMMGRLLMEIEMKSWGDMARAWAHEGRYWPAGGLAEALAC